MSQDRKRAQRKEEALQELHNEINHLREEKSSIESNKRALELEHKRELRELHRQVDFGSGHARAAPLGSAADTAKSLRDAFTKENEVHCTLWWCGEFSCYSVLLLAT